MIRYKKLLRWGLFIVVLLYLYYLLNTYDHKKLCNSSNYHHKSSSDRLKILIYGKFYSHILLPNFEIHSCPNSTQFSFKRAKLSSDFDVVILHFDQHTKFLEKYVPNPLCGKRIMIIYCMVLLSST